MESTEVSLNRWMDKEDMIYVYMCVYMYHVYTRTHTMEYY